MKNNWWETAWLGIQGSPFQHQKSNLWVVIGDGARAQC